MLGRLARAEAGELGLFLERAGELVEGGIHLLDRHLDAEQFLAGTQSFDGHVHDGFLFG